MGVLDVGAARALDSDEGVCRENKSRHPQRKDGCGRCLLAENIPRLGDQLQFGIFRQRIGIARDEALERQMNGAAALQRADLGIERIERAELQNMLGIDRIGIAHPGFDFGDR